MSARRHIAFSCQGHRLAGTLDDAPGQVALLLVTGGNETRAGAFSGQAHLAARIAEAGYPVFRYDRRGVGDSEGPNSGFRGSLPDMAAAIDALRQHAPQVRRIAGFGNCDAAAALMLMQGAGLDGLILSNPWTVEEGDAAPPPRAVRARYAAKMRNPGEVMRLLTGRVSLKKLAKGIVQASRPAPAPTTLAAEIAAGLAGFPGPVSILLADRDRTAQLFEQGWSKSDPRVLRCPEASHAFVEPEARIWLSEQLLAMLRRLEERL